MKYQVAKQPCILRKDRLSRRFMTVIQQKSGKVRGLFEEAGKIAVKNLISEKKELLCKRDAWLSRLFFFHRVRLVVIICLLCAFGIPVFGISHEGLADEKLAQAIELFREQKKHESIIVFLSSLDLLKQNSKAQSTEMTLLPEEAACLYVLFPNYYALTSSNNPERECEFLEEALRGYRPQDLMTLDLYYLTILANKGHMERLYLRMFEGYRSSVVYQNHPLAKKLEAVLLMRSFQGESEPKMREIFRLRALERVENTFRDFPYDSSLIQKALFLATAGAEETGLDHYMKVFQSLAQSLDKSDIAPYSKEDFFYCIQKMIEFGDIEHAKQLIQKGKNWYQYSRALESFELKINQ